jgi:hypothetical protein
VSAAVERFAAHVRSRLSRDADGENHFTFERALAHRVISIIGAVKILIRTDMYTVGALEQAFAPGAQEVALTIEDDHWVSAAIEEVDLILLVDGNTRNVIQLPPSELAPVPRHFVAELPLSHCRRHDFLLLSRCLFVGFLICSSAPTERRQAVVFADLLQLDHAVERVGADLIDAAQFGGNGLYFRIKRCGKTLLVLFFRRDGLDEQRAKLSVSRPSTYHRPP